MLIAEGKSRSTIDEIVAIIRRAFRWAVSKGMLIRTCIMGWRRSRGLRKGRSDAREPEPVRPVADEVVDATLLYLPPVVAEW